MAGIIRPQTPHNFSGVQFSVYGDLDAPMPRKRHGIFESLTFTLLWLK
jgi:hypothetical protein